MAPRLRCAFLTRKIRSLIASIRRGMSTLFRCQTSTSASPLETLELCSNFASTKVGDMDPYRITIHCSATRNGIDVPAAKIKEWHLARGFSDIGYHIIFQPSGQIENGRPTNVQGAHVKGDNSGNVGLCLVGNNKFTREQWKGLRGRLDTLLLHYDIPRWNIFAHEQFTSARMQNKSCPNVSINRLLTWYWFEDEDAIAPHIHR